MTINTNIFDKINLDKHEQVVFCNDRSTGLKAIIAIHNTQLGPSLGGCRFYPYASDAEALSDVLRLSKGMTYKTAVAGLNLGGGKSVIIGDPSKIASEELFRTFGRFVHRLGGSYITAEDIGTSVNNMGWVRQETSNVVGLPSYLGGSGDPSPYTAYGVFVGMKAARKHLTGNESLSGVKVAVQGVGNVGYNLCKLLHKDGAKLYVTDTNQNATALAAKEFGASVVGLNEIYGLDVDIYSPCALGATINDITIPMFKCPIIAGGANNQLAEPRHGDVLQQAGILYAPDYVINAGGLIIVSTELFGGNHDYAWHKIGNIQNTLAQIFSTSSKERLSTEIVADKIAERRLKSISLIKNIYLPEDEA